MKRMSFRWVLAVPFLCQVAAGQGQVERFERQLEQIKLEQLYLVDRSVPTDQRALVDYGGYFTFNFLTLDDNLGHNHTLREPELTVYGRVNIDNVHEFFVRGSTSYRDFNDGDSFDGHGDEFLEPELDRAFYRFDLGRYRSAYQGQPTDNTVAIKAGRDLVYWANGLTLSQVVDGVVVDVDTAAIEVQVVAGVTPEDTVDFDPSRPDFDDETFRGFYGVLLSAPVGVHRPYVYGLLQQDYNDDDPFVVGPVVTEFEYDSYYLGAGIAGPIGDRLLYGVEVVYEGGEALSNSFVVGGPFIEPREQTKEDINAFAADFRLDYLVGDLRNTRYSGEVILATGDDDRLDTSSTFGGNESGTDDTAFNAFGLLNTGLSFAPAMSNLLVLRVGASTFPMPDHSTFDRLQVGVDVFVYGKFDTDAPIDEPTGTRRYLGWEPDLFINWQITSDVTWAFRYGVFFPDSDNFLIDDARQFVFTSVTFAF